MRGKTTAAMAIAGESRQSKQIAASTADGMLRSEPLTAIAAKPWQCAPAKSGRNRKYNGGAPAVAQSCHHRVKRPRCALADQRSYRLGENNRTSGIPTKHASQEVNVECQRIPFCRMLALNSFEAVCRKPRVQRPLIDAEPGRETNKRRSRQS